MDDVTFDLLHFQTKGDAKTRDWKIFYTSRFLPSYLNRNLVIFMLGRVVCTQFPRLIFVYFSAVFMAVFGVCVLNSPTNLYRIENSGIIVNSYWSSSQNRGISGTNQQVLDTESTLIGFSHITKGSQGPIKSSIYKIHSYWLASQNRGTN